MPISFKCAGCAKAYTVKDELAGKRAQCKHCGQVMKIPPLAPTVEPDLAAEGADHPNANAETVAGSMISTPLDTLTGRGASAAGRSAAGRSAVGRSGENPLAAPAEPDYGQPPLSALKHVPASQHDAFDVTGGTDQPLRAGRGPASKNRAPMEPYSFLLIALMLGVLAYAAYAAASAPRTNYPADVVAEAGKAWGPAAAQYGVYAVMALSVVGPLVLGAWVAALKIVNVRLPDGLYVRSTGIAAVTVALLALSMTRMFANVGSIGLLVGAIGLAACYALLHFVHAQKPLVAAITTGIAAVLGTLGVLATQSAADAAAAPLRHSHEARLASIVESRKNGPKTAAATPNANPVVPVGPTDTAVVDATIKDLQAKVTALKTGLADKRATREKAAASLAELTSAVDAAKTKSPDRPEFSAMSAELASAKTQIDALPAAAPPPELTQAPPAGTDWSARPGRREVSVFGFNLTPPLEGALDLDSQSTPGGVTRWAVGEAKIPLAIEQTVAPSAEQQRPWVAPAYVVRDAKSPAFAVAADGDAAVEYGTINGLPAARITVPEPGNAASATYVYTLHKGTTWLKCTIGPVAGGDPALTAAQQAVRSLHERAAGEPVLDPLPAVDLVARFQSSPSESDKIVGMIKSKANAEEAVTKAMGFAPDDSALAKFGPLLLAVATEKSSGLLWKMAAGGTPLGEQARDALRSIEPKNADEIAFAVLDVKSGNPVEAKKGLAVLAYADPDKARLPVVSKALGSAVESQNLINVGSGPTLDATLQKWMDADLARRLQALLDERQTPTVRKVAMRALASTGDKKYVMPILGFITDANGQATEITPVVIEALVAMGPAGEGEIARLIVDTKIMSRPVALKSALRILDEIGTPRSLSALQTVMSRSGDPEARDAAKAIIQRIREKPAAAK